MNAYELANKMEQLAGHFHNEAINMLRQQADRIAELEKHLKTVQWALAKNVDIMGEMGWHQVNKDGYVKPTPQIKELSDKEIEVLWEKHCPFDLTAGIDFAKAILKKANEK